MHVETLKTFCDLVETGSLSRAARLNLVSQSAVSQQLRALEQRYGGRLIDRAPRIGARPTELGRLLYEEIKPFLERLTALEQRLRARPDVVAGTVRVATVYSVGLHTLPPVIKRCLADHPKVSVQLSYRRTDEVYAACLAGDVDFGIVAVPARRATARGRAPRSRRAGHRGAARPSHRAPRPLLPRRARRSALHRLPARHSHAPDGRRAPAPPRRARQLRHGARQRRDDQALGRSRAGRLAPAGPHAGRARSARARWWPGRPSRAPSAVPSASSTGARASCRPPPAPSSPSSPPLSPQAADKGPSASLAPSARALNVRGSTPRARPSGAASHMDPSRPPAPSACWIARQARRYAACACLWGTTRLFCEPRGAPLTRCAVSPRQ